MTSLEHEMTLRLHVIGPTSSTAGSPLGERQYWEMARGELAGERIRARFAMPGGDWYQAGSNGYGRPNVRMQFITDDGQLVLLQYRGLVQLTEFSETAKREGCNRVWPRGLMSGVRNAYAPAAKVVKLVTTMRWFRATVSAGADL